MHPALTLTVCNAAERWSLMYVYAYTFGLDISYVHMDLNPKVR